MQEHEEEITGGELARFKHKKVVKSLAWMFVIASILLFAAFVSAYIVSKMDKSWLVINLPKPFYISTIIILLSSVTLFLALKFARSNKQSLVKLFLIVTLFLGLLFGFSQYKGWKKLFQQGNVVTGNIFNTYGEYGVDFKLLKNGEKIDFNGEAYTISDKELSEKEEEELRSFVFQVCGDKRRETLNDYKVENYGNPYSILRLSKDSVEAGIVEFRDNKAFVNENEFFAGAQKDLFRFAFGVYHQTPYFAVKGSYGEDFTIRMNNEVLEFENKKLYFPKKELTPLEVGNINQKVFEAGKQYEIEKGKIFVDGNPVDETNFETFIQLKGGIDVHYQNGKWTRLREELNNAQYSELKQASNIASSYVYVFTGVHILHVLVALILLLVVIKRSLKGYYNKENQLGIEATGIIWHFLGVLWVSLFLLLQFFH